MLEAVLSEAKEAVLISAAIVSLFATGEWLHRVRQVRVEITRKITHVGAGLIVMTFPWVLGSPWTVGVLSVSFGIDKSPQLKKSYIILLSMHCNVTENP